MRDQNPLVGKTLVAVWLASDGLAIKFDVDGGETILARCDADCCSYTWIEGIDAPSVLVGAPIIAVEDIPMPDLGNGQEQTQSKTSAGESIAYYGLRITTSKGVCVLDYRNDSNGYYGGSLSWAEDDYFYGGVRGQNVSTNDWRKVA